MLRRGLRMVPALPLDDRGRVDLSRGCHVGHVEERDLRGSRGVATADPEEPPGLHRLQVGREPRNLELAGDAWPPGVGEIDREEWVDLLEGHDVGRITEKPHRLQILARCDAGERPDRTQVEAALLEHGDDGGRLFTPALARDDPQHAVGGRVDRELVRQPPGHGPGGQMHHLRAKREGVERRDRLPPGVEVGRGDDERLGGCVHDAGEPECRHRVIETDLVVDRRERHDREEPVAAATNRQVDGADVVQRRGRGDAVRGRRPHMRQAVADLPVGGHLREVRLDRGRAWIACRTPGGRHAGQARRGDGDERHDRGHEPAVSPGAREGRRAIDHEVDAVVDGTGGCQRPIDRHLLHEDGCGAVADVEDAHAHLGHQRTVAADHPLGRDSGIDQFAPRFDRSHGR